MSAITEAIASNAKGVPGPRQCHTCFALGHLDPEDAAALHQAIMAQVITSKAAADILDEHASIAVGDDSVRRHRQKGHTQP